jgi:hypothetical protein
MQPFFLCGYRQLSQLQHFSAAVRRCSPVRLFLLLPLPPLLLHLRPCPDSGSSTSTAAAAAAATAATPPARPSHTLCWGLLLLHLLRHWRGLPEQHLLQGHATAMLR